MVSVSLTVNALFMGEEKFVVVPLSLSSGDMSRSVTPLTGVRAGSTNKM
jgi:hypothetical protein